MSTVVRLWRENTENIRQQLGKHLEFEHLKTVSGHLMIAELVSIVFVKNK